MKRFLQLGMVALLLSAMMIAIVAYDSVDAIEGGWSSIVLAALAAVAFAWATPFRHPALLALIAGLFAGVLFWIAYEVGLVVMVARTGHFGWEAEVHAANLFISGLLGAAVFVVVGIGAVVQRLIAKRRLAQA